MITNKDLSIDNENGKITLNGNKYDLGTQGEIDTAVKGIYSVMGKMGAKNLIPYPYYSESGYSNQGMTTTYDADGVFTINKVAGTATAYCRIATLNFLKPSTKYRLVFEVENATSISIFVQKPITGDYVTINNKSSGIFVAEFETTADSQISSRGMGLSCTASDTETNATVKVMLVYASDTDNTYEPYAMTNKQLTEQVADVQDTIGDITQTGVTGASVAAQIGALNTSVGAVKDLYTSNVSFADAGTQAGINYGEHADLILTKISTLSTGIFSMDTPGPKIGVVLFKNTDDYFAGIILYYFATNSQKPLYFVYQNGTYGIKTL